MPGCSEIVFLLKSPNSKGKALHVWYVYIVNITITNVLMKKVATNLILPAQSAS